MALVITQYLAHIIATSAFCLILIATRCGYRVLCRCRVHTSCHRKWRRDDTCIALAVVPLASRAICLGFSFAMDTPHASPETMVVSRKLLIPGRISYAAFLWMLKLCVLDFYFRVMVAYPMIVKAMKALFWAIIGTFVVVVLVTLLECQPLSLFWEPSAPKHTSCREGRANLLTMAISNIFTDVALILIPLPTLWQTHLPTVKKIRLTAVFAAGIFVIGVTVARLPLILSAFSQDVRSMWASIEIATSCIVANVAFYYSLIKDMYRGHNSRDQSRVDSFDSKSHLKRETCPALLTEDLSKIQTKDVVAWPCKAHFLDPV